MINVLIVEDEIAISRFLRAALEGDGLRVHDAGTLQRGLIEAPQTIIFVRQKGRHLFDDGVRVGHGN